MRTSLLLSFAAAFLMAPRRETMLVVERLAYCCNRPNHWYWHSGGPIFILRAVVAARWSEVSALNTTAEMITMRKRRPTNGIWNVDAKNFEHNYTTLHSPEYLTSCPFTKSVNLSRSHASWRQIIFKERSWLNGIELKRLCWIEIYNEWRHKLRTCQLALNASSRPLFALQYAGKVEKYLTRLVHMRNNKSSLNRN